VNTDSLPPELQRAIEAAHNKKAAGVTLLDLRGLAAFTGWFFICTAFSSPQVAAIAEEIEAQLERLGLRLQHREGRDGAEWVLLDYGGFIVHIFTERARLFYDLERLWRSAKKTVIPDPESASFSPPGGRNSTRSAEEAS